MTAAREASGPGPMLAAVGVVFGDLGTSPLYALQEVFGSNYGLGVSDATVLGVLSLVFWSLLVVVCVKYVLFVMRADNDGEGGIMALLALAQMATRNSPRLRVLVVAAAIFGAALFYGDGVITPAISVLSAVEGIKVAAPALAHWVLPISVAILLALFALQRFGSDRVGRLFGPVMCLWFAVIALLGLRMIVLEPQVLAALNPLHALRFFAAHGLAAFVALGGVVLALTGCEALYADMGHFGKRAIRRAWFWLVLPALLLNYFGQGALLLASPQDSGNPFYRLVPQPLLVPVIVLAALATVIASQAVITGAFSMTRQAMHLGFTPRLRIVHTSSSRVGQVFMPAVNGMLMVLVLAAVLGFRSSENLGAAYGIAVTGTMLATTLLALLVAWRLWRWTLLSVLALGLPLLLVDLAFFGANLLKVAHGGWFPLALGLLIFILMTTWRHGHMQLRREVRARQLDMADFLARVAQRAPRRIEGTAVFLTPDASRVPWALRYGLEHFRVLHQSNVLLGVETLETPFARPGQRLTVQRLAPSFHAVQLRFGFAEAHDVPAALAAHTDAELDFDPRRTVFFRSQERIVATRRLGMALWRDRLFAFMARNTISVTTLYGIPSEQLVGLGPQVEI